MHERSRNPIIRYMHWLHTRWPAGTVERLPEVREDGSTSVPGLYVAGDLTGIPLLKFSSDTGARAVQAIARDREFQEARRGRAAEVHELAIIGAGVAGMAAALMAREAGIEYVVLEATQAFSTVVNFPRGKPIYTYPRDMTPAGDLQFRAEVKEALVEELREQTREVPVTMGRVESVKRSGGVLVCKLAEGEDLRALRVIVAIGRSGNFRKLSVPGEDLDKVYNRLHDPRDYAGQRALVVGGGDSALETAIALVQAGAEVTLSYRKPEFSRPKPDNLERIELLRQDPAALVEVEHPSSERVTTAAGEFMHAGSTGHLPGGLRLLLSSEVREIRPAEVVLTDEKRQAVTLPNDVVFTMIGREPPLTFLRRSGLRISGEWTVGAIVSCALFLLFCTALYNWKSGGHLSDWTAAHRLPPHTLAELTNDYEPVPGGVVQRRPWQFLVPAPARPPGQPDRVPRTGHAARERCGLVPGCAQDRTSLLGTIIISASGPSFWYTLAYSALIVIFGIRRVRRQKTQYVRWQTASLMAIQIVPLFLLPEIILPLLGYHGLLPRSVADALFPAVDYGHGREYWRAYGIILAWPLFVYNLFTDQPLWAWLGISLVQTFVLLPGLIYFYGKGVYCGWICSCGALAETLGDTQRQKMVHGPVSNRVNMLGQGILAVAFLLLLLRIVGWTFPGLGVNRFFSVLISGSYDPRAGLAARWINYKWVVDVFLAGIVGYGLYFWMSGRVWCRFACPLAALMHIYARFSRFRIFADKKKCISCNVCTSVCHMGIDVMNFANKGLPMQDPECVRCSACVKSCPTGVLTFGQAGKDNQVLKYDSLSASLVQIRENPAARKSS